MVLITWLRPRARRDITVPIGTLVTSAISRYESPWTSRLPVRHWQRCDGRLQAGGVGFGDQRRFRRLGIRIPGDCLRGLGSFEILDQANGGWPILA
jgi:hypothetical protein